jgi:EAL domain-containing protein (putative c-di-GMP-specific phosphodiesterase class I)
VKPPGTDVTTAMREARKPLLRGKAQWQRYQPTPAGSQAADMCTQLWDAIDPCGRGDASGLALHYQPIVDLVDGATRGYEALLRWTPPGGEPVPAAQLIDAAERTGLILPLGDWVIRNAITDAATFPCGPDGRQPYVSVNVSPVQLCQPDLADTIAAALAATGVQPDRVIIELIETQPMAADGHDTWQALHRLCDLGVHLAVDDYGTGNAVLGHLQQPIVNIVKLDRIFTNGLSESRNRALIRAVVRLAEDLGIDLIVEGIEDEPTRHALIDLGCRRGQGYLFGYPMPLAQATQHHPPPTNLTER